MSFSARYRILARWTYRILFWMQWYFWRFRQIQPPSSHADKRVVILTGDPWNIWGSKGDDAMLKVISEHYRTKYNTVQLAVVVANAHAAQLAHEQGITPLKAWHGWFALSRILRDIAIFSPDHCVILGADVMDGYYTPETSLHLLAIHDLLRRSKVHSVIAGFSFNRHAAPAVVRGFRQFSSDVEFLLRDPVSLERFRSCGLNGRLVADVAFLLKPDKTGYWWDKTLEWATLQHTAGRLIIAINLHPMFQNDSTAEQIQENVDTFADILTDCLERQPAALLLLPHDFRETTGDLQPLSEIYRKLAPTYRDAMLLLTEEISGAQLKGLVGLADCLISGRMHLSIGAISQGIPVAAFIYQDKFQGLFQHFELSSKYLSEPPCRDNQKSLRAMLFHFFDNIPILKEHINRALPKVLALAEMNFK